MKVVLHVTGNDWLTTSAQFNVTALEWLTPAKQVKFLRGMSVQNSHTDVFIINNHLLLCNSKRRRSHSVKFVLFLDRPLFFKKRNKISANFIISHLHSDNYHTVSWYYQLTSLHIDLKFLQHDWIQSPRTKTCLFLAFTHDRMEEHNCQYDEKNILLSHNGEKQSQNNGLVSPVIT